MKDQLLVSAQHDRVRKGFVPGVTFLLKKPPSPWEGGGGDMGILVEREAFL